MITLNLLERLFNIEINKDKDIGKVTVQYGPITTVKRYHTNVFQQLLNSIFRTSFQTIKELNIKTVCVTLTTNEGKMYTTVFAEDILDKVTTYNVIDSIIRPFGYKLLAAMRKDNEENK